MNSENSPSPTERAPSPSANGRSPAARLFVDVREQDAFEELYGLLYDESHGKGVKTIAGITALLEGSDRVGYVTSYGTYATVKDLYRFISAGLFWRVGQHVGATQAGHDAYDAVHVELKEVA